MKITLPGIPPSKKNSRIIIHSKAGRHFDIPSNEYQKWEKAMAMEVRSQWKASMTIDWPVCLRITFQTTNKRSWDLSNKVESVQDLLKKCRVISDDDRYIIQELRVSWKSGQWEVTEIEFDRASAEEQWSLSL